MDDEQRIQRKQDLEAFIDSPAGHIIFEHIDSEIKDGWEKFIELPVLQKTSKVAYNYQAKYEVLRNLKEWILSEIKVAE